MYFPYLFGKQSELLALRAGAAVGFIPHYTIPVIEPVKADWSGLLRGLDAYASAGGRIIVVMNPSQDELAGEHPQWFDAVNQLVGQNGNIVPALLCTKNVNRKTVEDFLAFYAERNVALVYHGVALSPNDMAAICLRPNILFHVVIEGRNPSASLAPIPVNRYISIRDNFAKLQRNADYGGQEFFSDDYRNYAGRIGGFGDYTVLGAQYETGGGKPGAVAIHLTYKDRASGSIYVEHFVSDDVERDVGDVTGKYRQALAKAVGAVRVRPFEFGDDASLQAYALDLANGTFPGLPKNKERQIAHHLDLVSRLLAGVL